MFTVKQMITRLNRNAQAFAETGEVNKSLAAMEAAAVLKRDHFDVKGKIDWFGEQLNG